MLSFYSHPFGLETNSSCLFLQFPPFPATFFTNFLVLPSSPEYVNIASPSSTVNKVSKLCQTRFSLSPLLPKNRKWGILFQQIVTFFFFNKDSYCSYCLVFLCYKGQACGLYWKKKWTVKRIDIFPEDCKFLIFDHSTSQNNLLVSKLLSNEGDLLSKRQIRTKIIVILIADG